MISEVTGGGTSLLLEPLCLAGCWPASMAGSIGVGPRTECFNRRRYDSPHVKHDHILLDGRTYHAAVVRPVHVLDSVAVGIVLQCLLSGLAITSHHQVILARILLTTVLLERLFLPLWMQTWIVEAAK